MTALRDFFGAGPSAAALIAIRQLAAIELREALETVDSAIAEWEALECPVAFEGVIAELRADRARLLAGMAECDRAYRALAEKLPS